MNIAFLSFSYSGIVANGASEYTERFLKVLSNKGNKVDFYCPYPIKAFKKIDNVNYIHVPAVKLPFFHYLSFAFNVSKFIKRKNYDIVHSNGGVGIFIKNSVDFETFHHHEKFTRDNIITYANYLIYRFALHRARHIITISDLAFKEIIQYEKINQKYVTIVNNSIDCSIFNQTHEFQDLRKDFIQDDNEKLLLCLGGLNETRKNQKLSVKTLHFLIQNGINANLIVIGKGFLQKELITLATQLKIMDQIYFLEYVAEIFPYYSIADLLLVPSLHEGFGYPYLEGPACGCKFIAFDTGIAKIAANAGLGRIAKSDRNFMKLAIEMIQNNEKIGEKEELFIRNEYSLESFKKKIFRIYNIYLNKRGK
ncbi:glycosyltransferase family 4 protein [Candidatus Lokiarchaeum ossiferum]|uniref:glycosyltransferase family 4 protein n=1 Tax=Candidatus Lokiarchaeum ossiferum TaxID=2951803 RepID=UPI00352F14FB